MLPDKTDHQYNLRHRRHNLSLSVKHDVRNFVTRQLFASARKRPAKTAVTWVPTEGKRGREEDGQTWRTFLKDLEHVSVTWEECASISADRSCWRQLAAD